VSWQNLIAGLEKGATVEAIPVDATAYRLCRLRWIADERVEDGFLRDTSSNLFANSTRSRKLCPLGAWNLRRALHDRRAQGISHLGGGMYSAGWIFFLRIFPAHKRFLG